MRMGTDGYIGLGDDAGSHGCGWEGSWAQGKKYVSRRVVSWHEQEQMVDYAVCHQATLFAYVVTACCSE